MEQIDATNNIDLFHLGQSKVRICVHTYRQTKMLVVLSIHGNKKIGT